MAQNQPLRELPLLTIEDAEFVYKTNFEGRAERYNAAGNRYFNVAVPPEMAEALAADGWNIKWTKAGQNHPNPDEHVAQAYVEVTVGYKFRPPKVLMVRDGRATPITESTISLLDSTEFSSVDIVIRARRWQGDDGSSGYKAWLKTFVGIVDMDDLDRKYAYLTTEPATSAEEIEDLISEED